MPFFYENPTAPRQIARRLTRALAQNRVARAERKGTTQILPGVVEGSAAFHDAVRTTVDATIRPVGTGRYRRLGWAGGEPHLLRDEFAVGPDSDRVEQRRSLLYVAQHTDLHLCDAQSEARIVAGQAFGWFHPGADAGHRPQETMTTQVFDQLVRATNRIRTSPLSGAPMAWCVLTGDHTDNRGAAEVRWWLDVLAGRRVMPNTGSPGRYEGVQRSGWVTVWNPDRYRDDRPQRHGHPHLPGLLDAAIASFETEGIAVPWLAVQGNHDQLFVGTFGPARGLRIDLVEPMVRDSGHAPITGTAFVRAAIAASVTHGNRRRWQQRHHGRGVLAVTADPEARRPIGDDEFRTLILAEGADGTGVGPVGHAFTPDQTTDWWSLPVGDQIQVIGLDTRNHTAGDSGRMGPIQTAWLESELASHHRRRLTPTGTWVDTNGKDRLVVIVSHHNSSVMDNVHDDSRDPGPGATSEALVALLHRYPNVILWFNGHSHEHRIMAHPRRSGPRGGFWEVSTSSLAGFPQQGRTFEIFDNCDGSLSILTTVIDHAAPPSVLYPAGGHWTPTELASLSRELAVNDDRWFDPLSALGTIEDRNVELPVPTPFSLH